MAKKAVKEKTDNTEKKSEEDSEQSKTKSRRPYAWRIGKRVKKDEDRSG